MFVIQCHDFYRITKDTRIAEFLEKYGDIAGVMEIFGVKRVGRYEIFVSIRGNGA